MPYINMDNFTLKPENTFPPEKGKVLISEPYLEDKYFKRTVVLICEYNQDGVFGLVLNKAVSIYPQDLIEDFPTFNYSIFSGGPVDTKNLFFIHSMAGLNDSIEIAPNLFLGGDFDQMKQLILTGELHPGNLKLFVGYSGWGKGQLEEEISEKSWVVAPTSSELIFGTHEKELWSAHLKSLGDEFGYLTQLPEDPSMN